MAWIKSSVLTLTLFLLAACSPAQDETAEVQILGRYELTEAGGYKMGWPGSGFALRARGTGLVVTITDEGAGIMDAVINGKESALKLRPGTQNYTIVDFDEPSLFDVSLTRRTEVFDTGLFTIDDIKVEGELQPRPVPERNILFVGDSITAGFGVRGNTKGCEYTPASNAPMKSYGALTAKALDAAPHLIAISGRGVVYNYGDDPKPVMPLQIDWALPDTQSVWDHSQFKPNAIVVALGTNDWSTVDPGQDKFRAGYLSLLTELRARFPEEPIVTVSGPLLGGAQGAAIKDGIDFAMAEMSDSNISTLELSLSETMLKWSCNYHPGRHSMVKMARDLSAHISGITRWSAATIEMPLGLNVKPPKSMKKDGKKHYNGRVMHIAKSAPIEGGVMFLGDSITEAGDWEALFPDVNSTNHGISWDTVGGVGGRLPQIVIHKPEKIFVKIGTNDIGYGHDPADMAEELGDVIKVILYSNPGVEIFIQSVLPREAENLAAVAAINAEYKALASEIGLPYIDLTDKFSAPDGTLRAELTYDGLHLNDDGYKVWADALRPYVED